jgi:dienelactone hydrolase
MTLANSAVAAGPEAVTFPVGDIAVHADLSKPSGDGPFPAVLWNHGGVNPRPGVTNYSVSSELGQLFTSHGYVFLLPHRRGYGRSPRYELAEQFTVEKRTEERNRVQLELMHAYTKDVAAAVEYLRRLPFVDPKRIAVAGCSFGGSLALFAADQNLPIRSVVNFAGAAVSWKQSAELRERMLAAAQGTRVPVLLVQAENDYDLNPTHAVAQRLAQAKKPHQVALFPAHGSTAREGHNFCETGGRVWESAVISFLNSTVK